MNNLFFKIGLSIIIIMSLGFISGFSTASSINGWYASIIKPSWNPPNWLFGPAWTILYICMGISFGLIWHSTKPDKTTAIVLFCIQFILNLLWSYIFFKQQMMGFAFVEIILMLIFIILTIISFHKINPLAAYLLIPYSGWVTFATILNGTIWKLNSVS